MSKEKYISRGAELYSMIIPTDQYIVLAPTINVYRKRHLKGQDSKVTVGQKSNMLVAKRIIYSDLHPTHKRFIEAECECGNYVLYPPSEFLRVYSCGCSRPPRKLSNSPAPEPEPTPEPEMVDVYADKALPDSETVKIVFGALIKSYIQLEERVIELEKFKNEFK